MKYLRRQQEPAKKESKKEKQKKKKAAQPNNIHKDLTVEEIKKMFPDMTFRDALNKLAALRRGE